jgi:hypothetical protein
MLLSIRMLVASLTDQRKEAVWPSPIVAGSAEKDSMAGFGEANGAGGGGTRTGEVDLGHEVDNNSKTVAAAISAAFLIVTVSPEQDVSIRSY